MTIKQTILIIWTIGAAAALAMGAITDLAGVHGASQALLIGFTAIVSFDVAKAAILNRGK